MRGVAPGALTPCGLALGGPCGSEAGPEGQAARLVASRWDEAWREAWKPAR